MGMDTDLHYGPTVYRIGNGAVAYLLFIVEEAVKSVKLSELAFHWVVFLCNL
jgi:hypothetical protein